MRPPARTCSPSHRNKGLVALATLIQFLGHLSIWPPPVRSRGERREVPATTKEATMAEYLLSVQSVEGEGGDPMTEEEMQQSWEQIPVLKEELWSAGALVFGRVPAQPP